MENQTNPYLEADERWVKLMLKIGRENTERFNNNPHIYTELLVTAQSTRHLMRWVYHFLMGKKFIEPIEKLPQDQKEDLWNLVLEQCLKYTRDKKVLKEIAMVFYAMNYFNQESLNKYS